MSSRDAKRAGVETQLASTHCLKQTFRRKDSVQLELVIARRLVELFTDSLKRSTLRTPKWNTDHNPESGSFTPWLQLRTTGTLQTPQSFPLKVRKQKGNSATIVHAAMAHMAEPRRAAGPSRPRILGHPWQAQIQGFADPVMYRIFRTAMTAYWDDLSHSCRGQQGHHQTQRQPPGSNREPKANRAAPASTTQTTTGLSYGPPRCFQPSQGHASLSLSQ